MMNYTDEVIRFIQGYDNGSMWDEFVVAFEDVDDADLDASDIIEWMQNYPNLYDAFITEGDDYNDADDVYEALNRAHDLDESKLKQNFICSDCRSKLTRNKLDRAMWNGVPYFICPCCEHPITRISASELDPDEEIEYEIYS